MFDVEFRPHPLFRNGHWQTVLGSYWGDNLHSRRTERFQLTLPDGDRLVLHEDPPHEPVRKNIITMLAHGLGGAHTSGYVRRTAFKLNHRGVRTVRIDLRGHGHGADLAKEPAHAGRSEDIAAALEWVTAKYPDAAILIAGFSLSANMLLKLAGEWADRPPSQVARVLAIAPPVDLPRCNQFLQSGWNRFYDGVFVRSLTKHVRRLMKAGIITGSLPKAPRTLREFDAQYTSIRSGFRDVDDYYERASSGLLLPQIQVPTTIVAASDDPIVNISIFDHVKFSPSTRFVVTKHGGHLGYIGGRGSDPDRRWLDWRIVDWVLNHEPATEEELNMVPRPIGG